LALALARADKEPVEDLLERWRFEVRRISEFALLDTERRSTPGRVEFEVHLDGIAEHPHETHAYEFGRFVLRTADSVKELVKSERGFRHHSRNLLVVGGPAEGSVRVTFREPDRSDQTAIFTDPPETAEGQALVYMASMFAAAEEATDLIDVGGLRASLSSLAAGARLSVARVADVVTEAGWSLTGVIRRGDEEAPVRLGLAGAQLLSTTSREQLEEEERGTASGTIDGWMWSRSELTLITDEYGTIRVSVPMSLQSRVAELVPERDTRVVTRLGIYRSLARGTRDVIETSYSLSGIEREDNPILPNA
jgi:hypothetical protein